MRRTKLHKLTKEYVRSRLSYFPKKGILVWKPIPEVTAIDRRWNTKWAGKTAGSVHSSGYIVVFINGVGYPAHVLIYLGMTGKHPTQHVDHRDGNPSNNRWKNLRHASYSENQWNGKKRIDNSSGYKGVSKTKWGYVAYINVRRKRIHLGSFETAELAHQERTRQAKLLHGDFARAI